MRTVPGLSREVPLGGPLRRLAERTTALGEAQIGMARAELARDFRIEVRHLRVLFAAMLLVAFGLQLLVVAMFLVLATRLDAWLATLIVSAPLLVAGVAVLPAARSRAGGPFLERTLEALGEDLGWLRAPWRSRDRRSRVVAHSPGRGPGTRKTNLKEARG